MPAKEHVVKKGESLWGIASLYYADGKRWPEIAAANKIKNVNLIYAGKTLTVPNVGPASTPAPASSPPMTPAAKPQNPIDKIVANPPPKGIEVRPACSVSLPPATLSFEVFKHEERIVTPRYEVVVKLKGKLGMALAKPMPQFNTKTDFDIKKIEGKVTGEYETPLKDLLAVVEHKFNPVKGEFEISTGFTAHASVGGERMVSYFAGIKWPATFQFKCKPREIAGVHNGLAYKGEIGCEIEVTLLPPQMEKIPAALPELGKYLARYTPSRDQVISVLQYGAAIAAGIVVVVAVVALAPVVAGWVTAAAGVAYAGMALISYIDVRANELGPGGT